jgi:hypothetical protein
MASVTVTFTAGSNAGAQLRRMAKALEKAAGDVPDQVGSGASTVLTIDNAPSSGTVSFQLTAGPYTNASPIIV